MVNTNYAHDNSVTCVCWKGNILATGSLDCTVKVKYILYSTMQYTPYMFIYCASYAIFQKIFNRIYFFDVYNIFMNRQ